MKHIMYPLLAAGVQMIHMTFFQVVGGRKKKQQASTILGANIYFFYIKCEVGANSNHNDFVEFHLKEKLKKNPSFTPFT